MTLNQQIYNETTDAETRIKIRGEYKITKKYLKEITMAYNEIQSINKKLDEITTSLFYTHEAIQKLNFYWQYKN